VEAHHILPNRRALIQMTVSTGATVIDWTGAPALKSLRRAGVRSDVTAAILQTWYALYMAHTVVVVGDRGRMVLPSAVRRKLGLTAGTRLLVDVEPDGSLKLQPFRAAAERGRGLLADVGDPDVSWTEDLIAQRRGEAASEG
jgi:AbrB family looped-hinge helix DNA binding protein